MWKIIQSGIKFLSRKKTTSPKTISKDSSKPKTPAKEVKEPIKYKPDPNIKYHKGHAEEIKTNRISKDRQKNRDDFWKEHKEYSKSKNENNLKKDWHKEIEKEAANQKSNKAYGRVKGKVRDNSSSKYKESNLESSTNKPQKLNKKGLEKKQPQKNKKTENSTPKKTASNSMSNKNPAGKLIKTTGKIIEETLEKAGENIVYAIGAGTTIHAINKYKEELKDFTEKIIEETKDFYQEIVNDTPTSNKLKELREEKSNQYISPPKLKDETPTSTPSFQNHSLESQSKHANINENDKQNSEEYNNTLFSKEDITDLLNSHNHNNSLLKHKTFQLPELSNEEKQAFLSTTNEFEAKSQFLDKISLNNEPNINNLEDLSFYDIIEENNDEGIDIDFGDDDGGD